MAEDGWRSFSQCVFILAYSTCKHTDTSWRKTYGEKQVEVKHAKTQRPTVQGQLLDWQTLEGSFGGQSRHAQILGVSTDMFEKNNHIWAAKTTLAPLRDAACKAEPTLAESSQFEAANPAVNRVNITTDQVNISCLMARLHASMSEDEK